jgi:hypothetical protein
MRSALRNCSSERRCGRILLLEDVQVKRKGTDFTGNRALLVWSGGSGSGDCRKELLGCRLAGQSSIRRLHLGLIGSLCETFKFQSMPIPWFEPAYGWTIPMGVQKLPMRIVVMRFVYEQIRIEAAVVRVDRWESSQAPAQHQLQNS